MRILIWQGDQGFAGEDLHRLAHRRVGPILDERLSEGAPPVLHQTGPVRDVVSRCAAREAERPDAVVLPTFRLQLWETLEILPALAREAPEVTVLLSGWGANVEYLDTIGVPLVHPRLAVALGEPEEALVDALELLSRRGGAAFPKEELSDLGLAIPDGRGGWESLGRFRQVALPGRLPSVYGTGSLDPSDLDGLALIEVARGCRHRCQFCLSCNFDPPGLRPFPVEQVVDEIRSARERGATYLALLCSALNYDVELLEAIADAVNDSSCALSVESTIHVSLLEERRLRAIRLIPWHRMIVGLQSITPEAMGIMDRHVVPRRFKEAIELVASFHTPVVELILGLPGDTLKGFLRTVRFALDLPARVEIYPLRLDPGTLFMSKRAELGLDADFSAAGRGTVLATPTFPAGDLNLAAEALRYLATRPWTYRARSLGYDFHLLHDSQSI